MEKSTRNAIIYRYFTVLTTNFICVIILFAKTALYVAIISVRGLITSTDFLPILSRNKH